jgi:DNA-binding NarL/FixJ family response regulator
MTGRDQAERDGWASGTVRVLLVDEEELVRRGVADVLRREARIRLIGEAGSAAEALARGRALRPDVVVVGMLLPDGSGAVVAEALRRAVPGVRCLVLSRCSDPATVRAAVRAGVSGYLLKHVRGPALADAVLRVADGGTAFGPEATAALSAAGTAGDHLRLRGLTGQECRILRLIGEGLSNREIGERLRLAEKTVKNYTTALLGKLGLANRTQAAVLATRLRAEAPDDAVAAGGRVARW